jgi:hypothetical protein
MIGQEITVHNLPKDYNFSSLEPNLWDKGGEEKLYIQVVFARIGHEYIYLNDQQVLDFDHEWVDNYTLVKSPDLLSVINYKGPYRVVVFNIKESKREELFKVYL